uniref:Uncharacterized protein n=1 Tax=Schizaphis graminum TaxID=13262 RepID=A0A2S2NZY5_SCHGA
MTLMFNIFIVIKKKFCYIIFRCNMAFGRTAPIIKTIFDVTSYKASRKYNEQHSIKRVVNRSSINHNRNFIDCFVYHIISTGTNCIKKIKKRLVGYTEIDSFIQITNSKKCCVVIC